MREYSYTIREELVNGLAPDTRIPTDAGYLHTCTDMLPGPMGLTALPSIAFPISGQSADSQILIGNVPLYKRTYGGNMVLEPFSWGTYARDTNILSSGTVPSAADNSTATVVPENGLLTYIEHNGTWFICNGSMFLTNSPLYTDWVVGVLDSCLVPRSVCMYMGRPVYAGIRGSTFSATSFFSSLWTLWLLNRRGPSMSGDTTDIMLGTDDALEGSYVMLGAPVGGSWDKPLALDACFMSAYNSSEFLPILEDCVRSGAIDFIRVPANVVHRAEPLGNRLMLYTSRGLYSATPLDNGGYSVELVQRVGIRNASHLCVTPNYHYFMDVDYALWRMHVNAGPNRLGYQEYLADTHTNNFRMEYDYVNDLLHISSSSEGYTMHGDAMCKNSQCVASLIPQGSDLYGVYRGSTPTTFEVITHPSEVARRAQKHIALVEVSYRELSNVQVALDVKYTESSAWVRTRAIGVNKEGAVFPRVSCTDFRVVVTGTIDNRNTATLDKIVVRWRPTDSRYIRGLTEQHASFAREGRRQEEQV